MPMFCLMLGMQLLLTFTVSRLKILCKVCLTGNSSSIVLGSVCPIIVVMLLYKIRRNLLRSAYVS